MRKITKQIPNILTFTRIIASILAGIFLLNNSFAIAISCYIYGAVTDAFDGFLARKLDAVSEFGKKLDPVSDKIFALSLTIPAIVLGNYALILSLVLETIIGVLNTYKELNNMHPHTLMIGKVKTVSLFPTMILGLLTTHIKTLYPVFYTFFGASTILQTASIKAYSKTEKEENVINVEKTNANNITNNNIDNDKTNNYNLNESYTPYNKEEKVKKLVRKKDYRK